VPDATTRPDPATRPDAAIRGVVFDLGNVLIEWNPRRLYRKLFADEAEMTWFLTEVCHKDWNLEQDRGRPWAEGIEEACARHPDRRAQIEAYHRRWEETMGGAIEGSVAILKELKAAGLPVFALTNWSAETFPVALERFDFLQWFDARIVSGEVGVVKPEPAIYRLMIERSGLPAGALAFIDDGPRNVAAAEAMGLTGLVFTGADKLRADLKALGLPLA
jgi:2-haloacid dehalogenase